MPSEEAPAQTETAVFEVALNQEIDKFFESQKSGLKPGHYEIRVPNRPVNYRNATESKTSPVARLNVLRPRGKREGVTVKIETDYRRDLTIHINILRK
ncbi:hypothetical protein K2P56_04510 [Patescibacteria group bacterium]|nr:hypothetical protein [Patescibacteria group bacterium]